MENMHIIIHSEVGEAFHVKVAGGDRDVVGSAYLHVSGALMIQPKEGPTVYLGAGQWESLTLGERDKSKNKVWVF